MLFLAVGLILLFLFVLGLMMYSAWKDMNELDRLKQKLYEGFRVHNESRKTSNNRD